jgi:hypothetical protein
MSYTESKSAFAGKQRRQRQQYRVRTVYGGMQRRLPEWTTVGP